MRMSGRDMQQATQGRWHGEVPEMIAGIGTDTRSFQAGQAFLALRGPNFDGHGWATSVADRAAALIGDRAGMQLWDGLEYSKLEVEDTLQALGDIAHAWRMRLSDTLMIAISGSYGKTSLRSMLETGFAGLGYQVAATRANLNNLIGVPQTLLAVPADADIAIIECGISEAGEMDRLSNIVAADVAVLTGISQAHVEGLGGLKGVVREKAALFDHLADDAWWALGAGVAEQLAEAGITLPASALNTASADAVQWQLDGRCLCLFNQQESASLDLLLPAAHWAANLALAAGILLRVSKQVGQNRHDISLHDIAAILARWQAPEGRMQCLRGINECLILNDSYNANPVSMQAALDTLAAMDGRSVAFLGDMAELGEGSAAAHAALQLSGIDQVYLIGMQMQTLAAQYPQARWFESTAMAMVFCAESDFITALSSSDTILFKASRSMGLDRMLALLSVPGDEGAMHAV